MFVKISSIFFIFSHAPFHALAKTCFAPDGSVADDTYQPCIAIEGVESMCCSLNSTTPDTCDPNGLCLSNADSTYGSNFWRDFCTDKTWDSPNCLSKTICDKTAGGSSSWTSRLTICDGGAYCCGTDKSCCLEGTTFKLAPTLVSIGNTTTATVTTTATATVTSNVSGSSKVAIGAGVGVPLAVLAVAMLGAGFLWGRRNPQMEFNALNHAHAGMNAEHDMRSGIKQADSNPLYEVSGQASPIELLGSKAPMR